jgi:hypothetical protein
MDWDDVKYLCFVLFFFGMLFMAAICLFYLIKLINPKLFVFVVTVGEVVFLCAYPFRVFKRWKRKHSKEELIYSIALWGWVGYLAWNAIVMCNNYFITGVLPERVLKTAWTHAWYAPVIWFWGIVGPIAYFYLYYCNTKKQKQLKQEEAELREAVHTAWTRRH